MSSQFLTYHSKGSVRNATALAQHRAKTDVTRVYSEEQRESTHTVREAAPQAHAALATSADVDFYSFGQKGTQYPATEN